MSDYNALIDTLPDLTQDKRKKKDLIDALPDAKALPGPVEDSARAAVYSVPKAVTGLAGMPRDLLDLTDAARGWMESKLPSMPKWLTDTGQMLRNLGPMALVQHAPGSADIRKGAETVTGPWYDPQTRTGKVVDTALQTAATMGRNLVTTPAKAAGLVAAITGGTEGLGALTNDNPWARLAGGVGAGAVPAGINAIKSRTGTVVRNAIGDVTPQQEAAAIGVQDRARAAGVPLMGTEALDRAHNLASHILSSLGGGQTVTDFITQRGPQVRTAVEREIIGSTRNRATPDANAARAQAAATDVIGNAERDRTAAARPYYDAARSDIIGPDVLEGVSRRIADDVPHFPLPSQQSALAQFQRALDGRSGMPASTVESLARGARIASDMPPIGATPADKQAAAAISGVRESLHDAAGMSPNIQAGRQAYQDFTRNVLDPLNAGPVGRVAGKGFDPAVTPAPQRVTSAVSDANARPQTIRDLYTHLNQQDAGAFPGIAKTWIENELDAALKPTQAGNTSAAGAKLSNALYGSPQQRANFDEIMRGVAVSTGQDPDAVVQGARNLMQVLERTGRTPGVGSQTASRTEIGRELGKSVVGDVLDAASTKPLGGLARRVDDWVNVGRHRELAEILTAPDSVQQLVKMAKLRPNGLTMRYYVASLLGLDRAIASDQ